MTRPLCAIRPLRPAPASFPDALRAQHEHSVRFVRALRALTDETESMADPAASLWLEGRSEEVAILVSDVLATWRRGETSAARAARAIEEYLHQLHTAMEPWFGAWYAPSCCGPLAAHPHGSSHRASGPRLRAFDTLSDTHCDLPAPLTTMPTFSTSTWPAVAVGH